MSDQIKFGTDGWRGHVGEDYTFANVRRCTQGFAQYLLDQGHEDQWVVVGHDRRYQGELFARAVAEVLVGNGLRVFLTEGPTPTPVISYSVPARKAVAAVNVTASHNPFTDNGFKVRDQNGGAVSPEGLKEIEANIPPSEEDAIRVDFDRAVELDKVFIFDPAPDYIAHVQELSDLQPLRDAGLRVMIDPMWGNSAGWFPRLLAGGSTEVLEIHHERNPLFPEMSRPEPIPPNINAGLKAAVEQDADVLLINDGDGDRVGLGDEHGEFIDQLRVFGLLAYYFLEVRGERGDIVKTLSTTTMLEKLGEIYGVKVHQTGVGFKYVAPKMLETDAMIGGEESGGYAFRGHVPERDGILAGLYLLDMMVKLNRKPSELVELLFDKVGAHFYDRIDTPFQGDREEKIQRIESADPETIGGLKVTGLVTVDGYKFNLEDGGWLLIRFSGTEPIIRVYTETTHQDKVDDILQDGLKIAGLGGDGS